MVVVGDEIAHTPWLQNATRYPELDCCFYSKPSATMLLIHLSVFLGITDTSGLIGLSFLFRDVSQDNVKNVMESFSRCKLPYVAVWYRS